MFFDIQWIDIIYGKLRYSNVNIQKFHIHLHNFIFNKQDEELWDIIGIKPYQFDPFDDTMYNANISMKNDRIIRICCVNYQLNKPPLTNVPCDNLQLYEYLDIQTSNTKLFNDITVTDLLNQCDKSLQSSHNDVISRTIYKLKDVFWDWKKRFDKLPGGSEIYTFLNFGQVYCIAKLFWFISPLFIFSRIFYFVFPIVSFVKEFNYFLNDNNDNDNDNASLSNKIDDIVLFQIVLFVCYYCLVVVWIINFVSVCDFYYWTKLLGIGSKKQGLETRSIGLNALTFTFKQYNKMMDDVIIQDILCQYLGNDIASIVFEYFIKIQIVD